MSRRPQIGESSPGRTRRAPTSSARPPERELSGRSSRAPLPHISHISPSPEHTSRRWKTPRSNRKPAQTGV